MNKKIVLVLMLFVALLCHAQTDAAFNYSDSLGFFIHNYNQMANFTTGPDGSIQVDGGLNSSPFSLYWPVGFDTIDAAFRYNDKEELIFFSGNACVRFNKRIEQPRPIHQSIAEAFPGMPFSTIDAALSNPDGTVYFFNGNQFTLYDLSQKRFLFDEPLLIQGNWGDMPFTKLDSAMRFEGLIYFYNDLEVIIYNEKQERCITRRPFYLVDNFPLKGVDISKTDFIPEFYVEPVNGVPSAMTVADGEMQLTVERVSLDFRDTIGSTVSERGAVDILYLKEGYYILMVETKQGFYLVRLDLELQPTGIERFFADSFFNGFHAAIDGGFYVGVCERDANVTYRKTAPAILNLAKFDADLNQEFFTRIHGGEGQGPEKSWHDYNQALELAENKNEIALYFPVLQNWAEAGEDKDIHQGDMFVVLNKEGAIKEDKTMFWTASHSQAPHMVLGNDNKFYTVTSGDSQPWGVQFYNRSDDTDFISWPSIQDRQRHSNLPYRTSSGYIPEFLTADNDFIAIMETDIPIPTGMGFVHGDILFLKLNKQGRVNESKWISRNPDILEGGVSAIPWGDGYLLNWVDIGDFPSFYPQTTMAVINESGDFIVPPKQYPFPQYYLSILRQGKPGQAIWLSIGREENTKRIEFYLVSEL